MLHLFIYCRCFLFEFNPISYRQVVEVSPWKQYSVSLGSHHIDKCTVTYTGVTTQYVFVMIIDKYRTLDLNFIRKGQLIFARPLYISATSKWKFFTGFLFLLLPPPYIIYVTG